MAYLTKYSLRLGYTFLGIIGSLILLTVFYYFDLVGTNFFNFLELTLVVLSIFINSFILGKASNKKGYIEGIIFGGIIVFLLLVPTLIFSRFKLRVIIYYIIIMITSILGSMIGISKKEIR